MRVRPDQGASFLVRSVVGALACLAVGAVACAPEPPAPPSAVPPDAVPPPTPPRSRLRLWIDGAAELTPLTPPAPARPVFTSRFDADLEGWAGIVQPPRVPGAFAARLEREGERAFVRLTGDHGGLHTVLEVEPGRCYLFTGAVRADGIEGRDGHFDGARFWLAQASDGASFEEFRTTRIDLMTDNFRTPQAASGQGWTNLRRMFVTTPETRLLHIVCSLTTDDTVLAGSVDFADLRLEAHPLEDYWLDALAREVGARAGIDPPADGAQAQRRVSAELAGESRPALVLLPGERLRIPLPPLAAGARLVFGVGVWRPTWVEARSGEALLGIRTPAAELLTLGVPLPERAQAAHWQSCELTLPPDVPALEFTLEGSTPLALGAARIETGTAPVERPNVLLISIDTLRADHVGAYGYALETTPNLDRLARAGLLCRDASATSPYTLPSHASLLTGQLPSVHGVVAHETRLAATRSTALAEILGRAGYATRAFTAGGFVNNVFGLDQGFEGFSEIDPIRERGSHYFRTLVAKHGVEQAGAMLAEHGFAGVERWLRAADGRPFFLFLHTYAVHDYDTPRRLLDCNEIGCPRPRVTLSTRTTAEADAYTPEMRAHVQHLYDAALRYTDERLGRLIGLLDELGLAQDTLIVLTSDHGEEFFEHGHLQHGRTLYQELLGIPLVLAGPGIPARVLERPAMLVDVVPTLLARLGLPQPPNLQGVDLLGPDWPTRSIWSEVDSRFAHKYALRDERGTKTLHGPPTPALQFPNQRLWEHYDLGRDPGEEHELSNDGNPTLDAARQALEQERARLEALGASMGASARGAVDEATLRDLSQLGYGGGTEE